MLAESRHAPAPGDALLHPLAGAALLAVAFLLPLTAAYQLSSALEPWIYQGVQAWISAETMPPLIHHLLLGNYGLLSLGTMSLIWALPVVLLIGGSLSLLEQSGVQSWAVSSMAPGLRRVGLSPGDIAPVLTGFGCNVVAVHQAQGCAGCRKSACLSMMTYASTCSYQLGAAFAVFGIVGHPWLVLPYLLLLITVGALHTRLWWGKPPLSTVPTNRRKLQLPSVTGALQAQATGVSQFFREAFPLFLVVCLLGAVLEYVQVPGKLATLLAPALQHLGIAEGLLPSILFSLIRKDGILIATQGGGDVLQQLTAAQAFIFVYFASALSSCAVTLSAIAKGSTGRMAFTLWGRQVLTAMATTAVLHVCVTAWG